MNQTLRRLVAYTSALAMAGAMTLPIIAGTAVANASVRPSKSLSHEQIARNFISHLKIGQPAGAHSAVGANENSYNWSGYADTPPTSGGGTYSAVSGSWKEPSVKCPATGIALAAFWSGIDGFSSTTVEQDGTIIECVDGESAAFDWWELYPTNDVQVVNSVSPGDSINSSVTVSGTSYTLTVTDNTDPASSFTTTQSCTTCVNSSAEWIAEAPCCKNKAGTLVYNLAKFGTWKLTKAAETYGGTPDGEQDHHGEPEESGEDQGEARSSHFGRDGIQRRVEERKLSRAYHPARRCSGPPARSVSQRPLRSRRERPLRVLRRRAEPSPRLPDPH
jgi:hypothetical protein